MQNSDKSEEHIKKEYIKLIKSLAYTIVISRPTSLIIFYSHFWCRSRPSVGSMCCGCNGQIHTDYWVLWRKRDGAATLSRGERLHPCLDRLLLLFWAHYIEDGPHLLCMDSGYTGPWKVEHRFWEVTLKIYSRHLLPQLRVREFWQKASLKAA